MDFKGLGGLMSQAAKMKEEMEQIQLRLAHQTVESTSGGGMVKVVANGKQEIVSLSIDAEVIKINDKQMLEDLVRGAVNQALLASKDLAMKEMSKVTGGLNALGSLFKGGS